MSKAIVKVASINYVPSKRYPWQFTLELICDPTPYYSSTLEETIYFNITPGDFDFLVCLSSKYDDRAFVYFWSEQSVRYDVRWIKPDTISFSSPTREYLFSSIDMQKLFPSTNQVKQEQDINPSCPECKGTGKVSLFTSDSPCSLCN